MSISNAFIPELRRSHLFSCLEDDAVNKMIATAELIRRPLGDMLFHTGDKAEKFYIVHTGTVKLFLLASDGGEKIIEIIQAGRSFAEAVMFMEQNRYPVNCQLLEASEILAFDNETYVSILRSSPEASFSLLAEISRRLHGRLVEIDNLCLHNATYRLVNYLLSQIATDAEGAPGIHLAIQKSDIAARLSIQRETFSRILARLKNSNLLKVSGSNIQVIDIEGLKALLDE